MSLIHHSLITEAFDTFNIPTGDALVVKEDGTFTVNPEADDFQRVMSNLVGQIVADHVTAKMVIPSNTGRLTGVASDLRSLLTYVSAEDRELIEDSIESIEGVVENLTGCMEGR
jgi:hypothetical protein